MTPERARWLFFLENARSDLSAVAYAATCRLGDHDAIALTRDETRDIGSVIALCARAAVLCDRLIASLSDGDDD